VTAESHEQLVERVQLHRLAERLTIEIDQDKSESQACRQTSRSFGYRS
jgi:phage gp16-like protein